jgi:phosphatidylglycerophosphate synthase
VSDEAKSPQKYTVKDEELLLEFYKKLLWNRIVPRIPASITPNSLTIVGQICGVLSAVATYGAAVGGVPFLYLVSTFLLLAYLTFDNIDGAHARRTGQTSPLGEFLDHGLDGLASTAALVLTGYVLGLHTDPILMVTLCALGGFGFTAVFWEQFRTGLLVIPKVSTTEGLSLLMLFQIARFFIHTFAPSAASALDFNPTSPTVGTIIVVIVLIGYAGAGIPCVMRAAKVGVKGWELLPLLMLIAVQVAFSALIAKSGAPLYMHLFPAATAGLIGADVTCRLIIIRHRGVKNPFIHPSMWLIMLPLAVPVLAPSVWTPAGWAAVSFGVSVLSYGRNIWIGCSELLGAKRAPKAA